MITNLDILDTTIKVGLGAFLGGYFTFATHAFIQDKTNAREKNKELRDHLYSILIKLGKSYEDTTHYLACAHALNQNPGVKNAETDLIEADQDYTSSFRGLISTPHELEILGFSKTSKMTNAYCIAVSDAPEIVQEVMSKGTEPSLDTLKAAFNKCTESIKNDYKSLFS